MLFSVGLDEKCWAVRPRWRDGYVGRYPEDMNRGYPALLFLTDPYPYDCYEVSFARSKFRDGVSTCPYCTHVVRGYSSSMILF